MPENLSAVVILAANTIAAISVFSQGWDLYPLFLLYWLENVIVGVCFIPRVFKGANVPLALFIVLIVEWFYAIVLCLHLFLLRVIFGPQGKGALGSWAALVANFPRLETAFLALVIAHGVTLWQDLSSGSQVEWRRQVPEPFIRIITLHAGLIMGGAIVDFMGQSGWALTILVAAKIAGEFALRRLSQAAAHAEEDL